MPAEQHSDPFAAIKGKVTSVTGIGAGGNGDIGDGLSTELVVGTTRISLAYWRLTKGRMTLVTSIEHGQHRSGEPIDALGDLGSILVGRSCLGAAIEAGSGDLLIAFPDDVLLRAFRFRRLFEDWEVRLPDGDAYWSNMVTLTPQISPAKS